jgi:flagellum-specific peptidoglycan hydrolase FlgJ
MRINRFFVLIFLAAFAVSCGSKKKVVTTKKDSNRENTFTESSNTAIERVKPLDGGPMLPPVNPRLYTVEDYIRDFAAVAMEEMRLYNIPASITLAQGILESGGGKGDLTMRANNHFGIKCHDWKGARAYHDDDARGECFRKYKDPKYSFRDHSLFLKDRRRYSSLFNLKKDDYKGWAYGLKKAGYATDPRYPVKLISIIERYQLQRFDDEVLGNGSREGNPSKETKVDYTSIRYTVKKGDTLYSISQRYNLTVEELKSINKLKSDGLSIGQKLYVKTL